VEDSLGAKVLKEKQWNAKREGAQCMSENKWTLLEILRIAFPLLTHMFQTFTEGDLP